MSGLRTSFLGKTSWAALRGTKRFFVKKRHVAGATPMALKSPKKSNKITRDFLKNTKERILPALEVSDNFSGTSLSVGHDEDFIDIYMTRLFESPNNLTCDVTGS